MKQLRWMQRHKKLTDFVLWEIFKGRKNGRTTRLRCVFDCSLVWLTYSKTTHVRGLVTIFYEIYVVVVIWAKVQGDHRLKLGVTSRLLYPKSFVKQLRHNVIGLHFWGLILTVTTLRLWSTTYRTTAIWLFSVWRERWRPVIRKSSEYYSILTSWSWGLVLPLLAQIFFSFRAFLSFLHTTDSDIANTLLLQRQTLGYLKCGWILAIFDVNSKLNE